MSRHAFGSPRQFRISRLTAPIACALRRTLLSAEAFSPIVRHRIRKPLCPTDRRLPKSLLTGANAWVCRVRQLPAI